MCATWACRSCTEACATTAGATLCLLPCCAAHACARALGRRVPTHPPSLLSTATHPPTHPNAHPPTQTPTHPPTHPHPGCSCWMAACCSSAQSCTSPTTATTGKRRLGERVWLVRGELVARAHVLLPPPPTRRGRRTTVPPVHPSRIHPPTPPLTHPSTHPPHPSIHTHTHPHRETRYFATWKRRRQTEEHTLPAGVQAAAGGQRTCPFGDAGEGGGGVPQGAALRSLTHTHTHAWPRSPRSHTQPHTDTTCPPTHSPPPPTSMCSPVLQRHCAGGRDLRGAVHTAGTSYWPRPRRCARPGRARVRLHLRVRFVGFVSALGERFCARLPLHP